MSNENKQNESKEQTFLLVPSEFMKSTAESLALILSFIKNGKEQNVNHIGGYISEEEAKKLLNKKTTWFWNMRTSGKLAFSKVGETNYYSKADLLNLIERSKRDGKL